MPTRRRLGLILLFLFGVTALALCLHPHFPIEPGSDPNPPYRKLAVPPGWWRGNTHTHTLWSDGGAAPEWVVHWYVESGYNFLIISDHNIMQEGERWVDVGSPQLTAHVMELRRLFGDGQVEVKTQNGHTLMRLKTYRELAERFNRPGRFMLASGEEITDKCGSAFIHVNGLNLGQTIPPQRGRDVADTINRNVDAIEAQGRALQRPVLAHLNHPNWHWSVTWQDLAHLRNDRFFEVFNGHDEAENGGDASHPSTEEMWDRANAMRVTELNLDLMYGLATDDSHDYLKWGEHRRNPGRGWLMVRAPELEIGAILAAMRRGDYYASTGVTLRDFSFEQGRYRVKVEPEPGVSYTTRFLGLRRGGAAAEVLAESPGPEAEFQMTSDLLYVRAVVTSSRLAPNPDVPGSHEKAWLQPRKNDSP